VQFTVTTKVVVVVDAIIADAQALKSFIHFVTISVALALSVAWNSSNKVSSCVHFSFSDSFLISIAFRFHSRFFCSIVKASSLAST